MSSIKVIFVLIVSILSALCDAQENFIRTSSGKEVILDEGMENASTGSGEFHFRKAYWGQSMEEVKSSEDWRYAGEIEGVLQYRGSLMGGSILLRYRFVQNQLVRGNYYFEAKHSTENLYLIDYNSIRNQLIKKYGSGFEEYVWHNDLFQDKPNDWGMAVSAGHLTVQSVWHTPKTKILLQLRGNNYRINMELQYESKRLAYLEDRQTEEKLKDQF